MDSTRQPNPGTSKPPRADDSDAEVMTPLPGGDGEYTVIPTTPRPNAQKSVSVTPGTAFSGGLSANKMSTAFKPSVPPQDLSDDKMILSAPRQEIDGRPTPLLGGIQILAKIGQGGMGAVYYGVHPRLNQEVAVKVLPFHLAERQPELIQRFIREAQIAARVRSPHLVGVIDVNEDSGLFYLVMEYVAGQTAGAYLRALGRAGQTGMTEVEALEICIGALEGLAAAHAHGVIHRDIKPDNILIPYASAVSRLKNSGALTAMTPGQDTRATLGATLAFSESKLADLGLARNETSDVTMTGINTCMGTPGYMSPEQAQDARHASKPADVFSMGATLYALISGDAPFGGTALMHMLNATVKEPHTPIRQRRPEVSKPTAALLDRCLAKKAGDRFADAGELLDEMRKCLDAATGHGAPTMIASPAAIAAKQKGEANAPEIERAAMPSAHEIIEEKSASSGLKFAAVLTLFCVLLALGALYAGYRIYQSFNDVDARNNNEQQLRAEAERKKLDAEKSQREIAAAEAKRADEENKARQVAEERKRKLQDEEAARAAELKRKEVLAQDALSAAVKVAAEYKTAKNWEGVILALDAPLRMMANKPHPNRALAEALVFEANVELERRLKFVTEYDRGTAQLKALSFDDAKLTFERAKKYASEDSEKEKLEQGFKGVEEGLRTNKIIQAVALERQGRALRPDFNPAGDWAKAAESFRNAAEIYQLADKREEFARNLVLQADCTRKDKNKNGDWSAAALLYSNAAGVYAGINDKKNQAEATARQALCLDPANNPSGDLRQTEQLYMRAAALHQELGNKKQQADVLSLQGGAAYRDKTRTKAFEIAADVFRRAAALYGELGDKKAQGVSVLNQAFSVAKGQRSGIPNEARELLKQAATLCREAGDEANAKLAESWLK